MPKGHRIKPEQIVMLLRQIDVLTANGKTLAQSCKDAGVGEQNYYRWRKMYGGMQIDQAKKYKELETENARLKKLVADVLDRIDQFEDFRPREHYALTIHKAELRPIERQAMRAIDIDEIELDV